jgi:hypothetical protein
LLTQRRKCLGAEQVDGLFVDLSKQIRHVRTPTDAPIERPDGSTGLIASGYGPLGTEKAALL